jgi:protein-S-isoprenylcysteine O-methyltransferase Ste14
MTNAADEFSKRDRLHLEPGAADLFKQILARVGRSLFTHRLEIGLGVTAVAAPFVRPTIATKPSELRLKAGGLCMVLTGLGIRAWAAGFAGRHTRSSKIEGIKLATAGPYAHVRNPIYLGSFILGFGMVLLIGDRRLAVPCALTFLVLYFGLIPAEEEFLSQRFRDEYEAYCQHVPRLVPRLRAWADADTVTPFDSRAARGEWRLGLILATVWGIFRAIAARRGAKGGKLKSFAKPESVTLRELLVIVGKSVVPPFSLSS